VRTKLILLGAGNHGKVLADLAELLPEIELVGLLDDAEPRWGSRVLHYPVLGPIRALPGLAREMGIDLAAFGIGDNQLRRRWFEMARRTGLAAARLVHPSAVISRHVELGEAVAVLAGVVVNVGAVVGDNVCLNTGSSIDHDCRLGDHSHIFPNATLAGGVEVGAYATVGSNAVVNPNVRIGRNAYVGAGAVVLYDVGDDEVVVGNPARLLRRAPPPETCDEPVAVES